MQIQRVIEESMGVVEETKNLRNSSSGKIDNGTTISVASVSSPEDEKSSSSDSMFSREPEVVSANRSFLHGQDCGKVGGNFNNDGSPSERVVYATLDSLALKRARLPLQLVPIDDETEATCEKKEKNVSERRVNSSRKTSPKRPSFKVRPGVPITGQWKSRPRSAPRLHSSGKSDIVSKDLASRLIIFENIIRSNNSAGEIVRDSPVKIVPEPEAKSYLENSNFPRESFEIKKSPKRSKTKIQDCRENLTKNIDAKSESRSTKEVSKEIETSGESKKSISRVEDRSEYSETIEVREVDSSINIDFDYRSVVKVSKKVEAIDGSERSISRVEDRTKNLEIIEVREVEDTSINIDSDYLSQETVSKKIDLINASEKSILSAEDLKKNATIIELRDIEHLSKNIDYSESRSAENRPKIIEARNAPEKSYTSIETLKKKSETIELRDIEAVSIPKNLSSEISQGFRIAEPSKKNRRKPEFAFAKSVLHSRRSKNKKKSSKSRQRNCEQEPEVSNLESSRCQSKSFSREELRSVSISLPTNFVHLASATNPKLLEDGKNSTGFSRVIQHEEKFAELEYLGEIEIGSKVGTPRRKSVRNSLIETGEYASFDFAESASSSSSSSSSSGDNAVEARDVEKRAKVSSLENSQGVPEVVKRSENEGSVDDDDERAERRRRRRRRIEKDTEAPVYESMSEFLTTTPAGAAARANESFLWGGRAAVGTTRFQKKSCVDEEEIHQSRDETRQREIETGDFSIGDDNCDAYDDVGLSRENTEEDLYDDVGLPSEAANNFSSDTLFEKIDVATDSDLYDDVSPGPITTNGSASLNGSNSLAKDTDQSFEKFEKLYVQTPRENPSNLVLENLEFPENYENPYLSIGNDYSSVEEGLNDFEKGQDDDTLYDDVELPSQDRVNSLYAGSSSGSQLGSLYNGKESEWEDLEEAAPVLPLPKKNNVIMRNSDVQGSPSKKKTVHRWSRKVRRQKSKASRKNPTSRSTSRTASAKGTSTFFVAVSLGTGSVLLVGSSTTTDSADYYRGASDDSRPPSSVADARQRGSADGAGKNGEDPACPENTRLQTRGLVQLRILGRAEDSVDTQETSCYVLEDTASDDSNYETLCSFPSDEFSSGSDDDDSSTNRSSLNGISGLQCRVDEINQEAPSRPVPPPPRESSLTETFGKRMKMLRRTWSITKGSLGLMRRRASTTVEPETSAEEAVKYPNGDQPSPNNDGRKYFSFKKHFRKSLTGLSTFYLDNDSSDERLSRNNNRSKEEVYSNGSNSSWYTNTDYWKNGVSEQSQRNDVDHYSMLDEEPLYQFYAAAAARVAFESDSEGYEEVEDPMLAPSAADLAKPGHRTLWCQTPQVINSDLLQRLTPDEKKVQEAKFEIFTSEASYLNSLRVLVDEFLNNHELVYEVLTPSEREKLFGGVPGVLIASERLLAELETVWREDVMLRGLPEVLLNYAQRSSSVYIAYCSNQVSIDTTLKELRSKKGSKFVETVTRIESHPACQSLSLHSFLMLPMQRVTRLPLLADAVLSKLSSDSKEERTCWECVLSQLSQVVMECNEGARAAGRLAEMVALERKLEYSSKVPPIVLRDRYLVRRGPVVQMLAKADAEYKLTFGKKYHKASLYLLLLTDYLLIAKPKSNANEETYTVIDTCKRSLVALEKVPEDSPFAGRHAMVLSLLENYSSRHVEYILTCNNATERERWLDAVSPPKPSLVGETLYETWDCPQVMALYPYAAAQPDELTLQPGDVINVLRKMTDGWHLGEKLLGGEQGWFPGNYAKEVASEHVRARNLRQRHRLLALSASVMQQLAKQSRVH